MRQGRGMIAAAALCMALFCGCALAEQNGIGRMTDMTLHAQHLEQNHFRQTVCRCTGDNVLLRETPGVKKNVGSIGVGDGVRILETYDVWAKVLGVSQAPANRQTERGMIGWIGMEYISCGCEATAGEAPES